MTDAEPESPFDPKAFLNNLTQRPGVYRMLDEQGTILYVGKARNLKKRVSSYFRSNVADPKTRALVKQICGIEVTVTNTEGEALLLENNLIKEHRPRYNILLRDDKSYPYIYLSRQDDFPRLSFYRGSRKEKGRYFGPYPSAGAARSTLQLLQKLFPVRQCEDSFYRNRSRPCLQYQIQRCTAPCVDLVSKEDYADDVKQASLFLDGKSTELIEYLVKRMESASQQLEFEKAARFRDQIATLRRIQERQYVSGENGDMDIISCVVKESLVCVQVFFIRAGHNLGNKAFFPSTPNGVLEEQVLEAFLGQYYENHPVPPKILLNKAPEDIEFISDFLNLESERKIQIVVPKRGELIRWVDMATQNAEAAIQTRLAGRQGMNRRYQALQELLQMDEPPKRMECFDISHTMGEATVASCVVFDSEGPKKSDYRRFNIEGITPGDDYAAMQQALTRRYTRIRKGEGSMPDILFIDGGKGQLQMAVDVMTELQIDEIILVGVAKGSDRKPGLEQLFMPGSDKALSCSPDSPALHLIQQIRDEAHRFAITGHRQRRSKARQRSVLEDISGLGPKRRQTLLKHFGGLQGIERAAIEDLCSVPGISRQLAEKIYGFLHGQGE